MQLTFAAGLALAALVLCGGAAAQPALTNTVNGASARTEMGFAVFQTRCLTCHGKAGYERAPSPAALREMPPERIYEALTTGIMAPVIGNRLTEQERKLVAESVSGRLLGTAASGDAAKMANRCAANPRVRGPGAGDWNGWGVDLDNSRYQPTPGLSAAQVPQLKLKWAFGFPDGSSAYGQPSVVGGRVYVGADTGYVYSIDAKTGCVYWSAPAKAGVRNAMTVGPVSGVAGVRYAVFFGDVKSNVYAVDAQTGRQLWVNHVEDNITARITAAPAFYKDRLYVPLSSWEEYRAKDITYGCCTSVGAVAAVDASTGKTLWKTYVIPARPGPTRLNSSGVQQYGPAGGSIWNTPTVDPKRGAIYVGTGDSTTYPAAPTSDAAMALEMRTGKVLWSYQVNKNDSYLVGCTDPADRTDNCPKTVGPDWDIPASPILRDLGGGKRLLVVATKSGDVVALDPDRKGAFVWRKAAGGGPLAGDGPAPPGAAHAGIQWGGAAGAEAVYFGLSNGQVAAMRLASGERLWAAQVGQGPSGRFTAAATLTPGVTFLGSTDGKLFALSSADGRTLWSFDTARQFDTVNKVPAKGGSISAPGATIAGGMVFVGSGYSTTSGEPGNVLLAFGAP